MKQRADGGRDSQVSAASRTRRGNWLSEAEVVEEWGVISR